MDKLQIIEPTIIGRNVCCMVPEDEGTLSSDRRAIECPKPGKTIPCDQRLFQFSAPPLMCGRRVAGTASPADAPKTVGLRPTVLARCLMAGDGRPSIRPERLLRGLLLQAFYTVPEQYQQRWAIDSRTVASCGRCRLLDTRSHDDHWTKCRHPETAHNTVSSYDCTVRSSSMCSFNRMPGSARAIIPPRLQGRQQALADHREF
jgi:hypothetical protein